MKKKLHCIMLIDDDDDDNYFHQIIINKMNITERIEVALNGEEALIFLTKENQIHPDIIFLDINMPKMNGWEFLDAYKELRENQKAKVVIVMLTTSINPLDKERAQLFPDILGFNSKPLTEEILNEIIEKHFSDTLDE